MSFPRVRFAADKVAVYEAPGNNPVDLIISACRLVAKQLGDDLKVSVVVENMIAGQAVARAAPDGYTLLLITDAMVTIDPYLSGSNKFDLAAAMVPVINMAWAPLLLAASNDLPANSVAAAISETFRPFNIINYVGLMLPKGTPQSAIAILNKEISRISRMMRRAYGWRSRG
jgi:hypothetical protein